MAVALPRDVLEERQRDIARRIRECPDPGSPVFRGLQDAWCAVTYALERPAAHSSGRPARTQPLYGTTRRAGWRLADPRPTWTTVEQVERHTPQHPQRLELPQSARSLIHGELLERRSSGVETGGGLYGRIDGDRIIVMRATVFSERHTRRTTTSVRFLDRDLVGSIGGVLGLWHNHPDGDVTPSEGDLSTALRLRDEYGLSRFVTVIVPSGEDAWVAPPLAAWAVRRSPLGRAVYERVEV